jgi:hypothetical protein
MLLWGVRCACAVSRPGVMNFTTEASGHCPCAQFRLNIPTYSDQLWSGAQTTLSLGASDCVEGRVLSD